MSYKEFNPDTNLGYEEFFVSVKVKTIGGYLGDNTTEDLKSCYKSLLESGDLQVFIQEHLKSVLVGDHHLGYETCKYLGIIDKLIIEVGE